MTSIPCKNSRCNDKNETDHETEFDDSNIKVRTKRKRKITIVTDSESDSGSETGIANSKYKKKENEDREKRKGVSRVLSASDFRSLPPNSVDLRNSTDSAPNSVILPNIHRLYPFVVHKYVTFGL